MTKIPPKILWQRIKKNKTGDDTTGGGIGNLLQLEKVI